MKRSVAAPCAASCSAAGRQEDEDVDVGIREQLAAAVAADGDERGVVRHFRFAPELADRDVDLARESAHESERRARGWPRSEEACEPCCLGLAIACPQVAAAASRGGRVGAAKCGASALRCRRVGYEDGVAGAHAAPFQAATKAGGGGVPAEIVSTS